MIQLASHTIDERLLPEAPLVLDVGCRGFDFAAAVMKLRPKARVLCLDPDIAVQQDERSCLYWHCLPLALIGTDETVVEYCDWHDGFGNFVTGTAVPWFFQHAEPHGYCMSQVNAINIATLSAVYKVAHWDLVKLDCEASEFSILQNWPGPIATQISVDFHDYTHREKWNAAYFEGLFRKLSDYDVVQHEDFAACDNAMGHWDSLLIMKGAR